MLKGMGPPGVSVALKLSTVSRRRALPGDLFGLTFLVLALATACTSVGSSAVRTGPARLPPRSGPIAILALAPAQGVELGVVEVHGMQSEAELGELMPELARRVTQLGGDAAVVDSVRARFDIVEHPYAETYTYACGLYVCMGTRLYSANDEVMTVIIHARAFRLRRAP